VYIAPSLTNKTNIMQTKLQYATKWFQLQNIPTIIIDNSIYLETGHFELELSEEEISYRAECYLDSENQKVNQ
jgi:hypothetical protein